MTLALSPIAGALFFIAQVPLDATGFNVTAVTRFGYDPNQDLIPAIAGAAGFVMSQGSSRSPRSIHADRTTALFAVAWPTLYDLLAPSYLRS